MTLLLFRYPNRAKAAPLATQSGLGGAERFKEGEMAMNQDLEVLLTIELTGTSVSIIPGSGRNFTT